VEGTRKRRRPPYLKSQSDTAGEGFRGIRQVGVAYSIGLPLMIVGLFVLLINWWAADSSTALWVLGGGLMGAGLGLAASGRII
jgi:hypothetical protein